MMNRKIIAPPRFPMIIAMLIDEDLDELQTKTQEKMLEPMQK